MKNIEIRKEEKIGENSYKEIAIRFGPHYMVKVHQDKEKYPKKVIDTI